ncbi:MAG: MATE family efflux transporter [Oscillospiraceae bacterium]|nr:MATE family efflux transporter [Oscillospiraceae bacterium]
MSVKTADKYSLVEGRIINKLFFIAAPLIMTQVFQMTYNLTDMFWLGRLSSDAVAASGTVGLFLWMSIAFLLFGRMGAEIGVSQSFGRGNRERGLEFAQNSIVLSVVLGILLAIVFILGRTPFVGFFQIPEAHVAQYARDYLSIVSLSLPMAFIIASVSGVFNGAGNSRTSLLINGLGFALNMILTPILIFGSELGIQLQPMLPDSINVGPILIFGTGQGIRGAAIATVIAQSVAACFALLLLKKHKKRPFAQIKLLRRLDTTIIKQIFKWVTPISIESFLFTFLTMLVAFLIASYGARALAAARISSQIESLTWLIGGGFASALTAFTGQNFGAGKWDRISKGFKLSSVIMSCWGLVVALILFFGGRFLIEVFAPNAPEVVAIGVENLRILSLVQIPQCLEGVAAGIFRGQSKTIPPSIASVTSNILRVVLAFVLVHFTDLGLTGVWIAIATGAGLRGIWIYVWYLFHSRKLPKLPEIEPNRLAG